LVQGLGRNATLTGRTDAWPQFLKLAKNPLVGVGYESFWLGDRLQKVWVISGGLKINEAHNGYVEVLLTLGWVGLAFMGVLIATGYRNVIAAYRLDPEANNLRIAWFLAAVITGLTESAFRMMGLPWIVFLLATANSNWASPRKTGVLVPPTRPLETPRAKLRFVREEAVVTRLYAR
jgi:O-antigen ligase